MRNDLFRKEIIFVIVVLFVVASIGVPSLDGNVTRVASVESLKPSTESLGERPVLSDYTHTVFVGVGTSQSCKPCHPWNQHLNETYVSGQYDFEYVEMIECDHDGEILNQKANEWSKSYGIGSYPTSIFDGDYQRIVGNHPEKLPDALDTCGDRAVADITANITLSWLGNATIQVNISIQNNESTQYNGYIRAFIAEIVSRYDTYYGDPYHFGFLDFAFDKDVSIDAGEEYVDNTTWNGNEHEDEHGDDFGDINANNIQVTMVVYNDDGYVDETVRARMSVNNPPNEPHDPIPSDGATDVDINVDLSWSCSDPDGDNLTYNVYFEENNPIPDELVSENQTENTYDPGAMDYSTHYYWQIVAWDEHGAFTEGPVWDFTTGSYPNAPPYPPSDPDPEDGATDIPIDADLNWTGGDPDLDDTIVYDVYLEANDPTPDKKVADDISDTWFDPGTLKHGTTYYWMIYAMDNHFVVTKGPVWHFTTTYHTELEVAITNPTKESFYLRNIRLFSSPFGTIVYGPTTIKVNATSSAGIRNVEFYIDNELKKNDTEGPYRFRWTPLLCSMYTIKVVAFDNMGNQERDEITVLKWRVHPVLILAGILVLLKLRSILRYQ